MSAFRRTVTPSSHQSRIADEHKFSLSDSDTIAKLMKPALMKVIEVAFRRYVQCHGVNGEMEDLEWTRFHKILDKVL